MHHVRNRYIYAVLLPKVIRLQHHHKPKQIEREFIVPFPASHSLAVNRIEIAPGNLGSLHFRNETSSDPSQKPWNESISLNNIILSLALLTRLFFPMVIFLDGNEWKSQKIVLQQVKPIEKCYGLEWRYRKCLENKVITKETVICTAEPV